MLDWSYPKGSVSVRNTDKVDLCQMVNGWSGPATAGLFHLLPLAEEDIMAIDRSYLADVEEVVARLRGKRAARFHRELASFLKGQQKSDSQGAPGFDELNRWVEFYESFGIPIGPRVSDAQKAALTEHGFRPIFFPAVGEDAYPADFVRPDWDKFLKGANIERRALPGRLCAVETIAKPDWNDPAGYANDRLAKAVGLDRRFGVSSDDLHNEGGILGKVAQKLGFPPAQVRCPSAEERNFVGNIFNQLREKHGENLPDLGSTDSWEWCENTYGSDFRLIAGGRDGGGLSAVGGHWQSHCIDNIGFRVLVVL